MFTNFEKVQFTLYNCTNRKNSIPVEKLKKIWTSLEESERETLKYFTFTEPIKLIEEFEGGKKVKLNRFNLFKVVMIIQKIINSN